MSAADFDGEWRRIITTENWVRTDNAKVILGLRNLWWFQQPEGWSRNRQQSGFTTAKEARDFYDQAYPMRKQWLTKRYIREK